MLLKSLFPQPVFAPETLTGRFAARTFPKPGIGWATQLVPIFGSYTIPGAVEDGDIFEMCWIPKNFLVMAGLFQAVDLDTGTETLDMDLGWAANGGGTETYTAADGTVFTNAFGSATPAGFLNMGVLSGDPITDLITTAAIWRPIPMGAGLFASRDTLVQVEANAPANAGHVGGMSVLLLGSFVK